MNKTLFLERLQRERDAFEILLNRVGFTRQMTMKGVTGSMSVKDLLADILTREQFIADRMNEILHNETYTPCASHSALEDFYHSYGYPDYESSLVEKGKINHLVVYRHKNIGLDEIVSQELATYSNIIAVLEKLTHAQCLDHDLYHRMAEHTYRPYRRMSAEIHRWLKSIAAES
ncbi:MAG: hypothetical protein U0Z26_02850 [Anaerolineales bacterium]